MSPRKPASAPEPESNSSSGDKPGARIQYGSVSAAVFSQQRERGDGQEFTDYTISLRRSYRDKEGQWQNNSITFFRREVLAAAQALIEAYKESYRLGAQEREETELHED